MDSNLFRKLPKVDELLSDQKIRSFLDTMPRDVVLQTIREVLEQKRNAILTHDGELQIDALSYETVVKDIVAGLSFCEIKSLRKVINATGVVLHTNLGRANLCAEAVKRVNEVADAYSTLEYDPNTGKRGSRHSHVEKIIREMTGAEAAMVVNNNAAATMLCLAALCRGGEVIISRGELVEIGGSFRVPEIMEESGAKLIEVGTTNKTKIQDYEKKICENTAALMKVHTSNYKIIGFTEEVPVRKLKRIGERHGLPVIYDLGSGLMMDLSEYGIHEPTVQEAVNAGADVVLFSGDKLLGGPQAGVLVGKKSYIDQMKEHPLARVLRVDKLTLAAIAATFEAYYDLEKCKTQIPVLAMITAKKNVLQQRAEQLKKQIAKQSADYQIEIAEDKGMVGGGSAPNAVLTNIVLEVTHESLSASKLAEALRKGKLPIIARIHNDKLILDVRTISDDEIPWVARKLADILREENKTQKL